jgi:hypothetical protein
MIETFDIEQIEIAWRPGSDRPNKSIRHALLKLDEVDVAPGRYSFGYGVWLAWTGVEEVAVFPVAWADLTPVPSGAVPSVAGAVLDDD